MILKYLELICIDNIKLSLESLSECLTFVKSLSPLNDYDKLKLDLMQDILLIMKEQASENSDR